MVGGARGPHQTTGICALLCVLLLALLGLDGSRGWTGVALRSLRGGEPTRRPLRLFLPVLRLRGGSGAGMAADNDDSPPAPSGGSSAPPVGHRGGNSAPPASQAADGSEVQLGDNATNNEVFARLLNERDETVRTKILHALDASLKSSGLEPRPRLLSDWDGYCERLMSTAQQKEAASASAELKALHNTCTSLYAWSDPLGPGGLMEMALLAWQHLEQALSENEVLRLFVSHTPVAYARMHICA